MQAKPPPAPVFQENTIRRAIIALLEQGAYTAKDISHELRIPEKEVYAHLEHIRHSLQHVGRQLAVTPASCNHCGFQFKKRDRVTKPGKCPVCRHEFIAEPQFSISAG